jgi:hypothetical protein
MSKAISEKNIKKLEKFLNEVYDKSNKKETRRVRK